LEWSACYSCSAQYPNTHCEHCSVDRRPSPAIPCCCDTGYVVKDNACVPANNPPNTPTLIAPPHNTWINYNPTFKARISDPDNDDVRAYFNVSGYGNGWGNWVANGGTSQWGPVNLGTCSQYWWRAYAQDTNSTNSPWSGYWKVRVDKDNPIGDISYPNGEINSLSFDVSLTESDTCSGINQGKVEIKTKAPGTGWGDWKPYDTTIDDFTFTGQDGYSYWFRYQVKDNANNWSDPVQGGDVTIKLNKAPQATNLQRIDPDWCAKPPGYFFSWIYSDPDEDTEKRFDFQIDNNSNFSSPEIDRTYDNLSNPSPSQNTQSVLVAVSSSLPDYLTYNQTYYWRARVWDSKGANSGWVNNGSFTTQPHHYPLPDFTWQPQSPFPEEQVQFTDESKCYDDVITGNECTMPNDSFYWDFDLDNKGGVVPLNSILENPTAVFSEPGTWKVKLEVTDSHGYKCPVTKTIRASLPLPRWKEIRPW